jgi:hypothetical protein
LLNKSHTTPPAVRIVFLPLLALSGLWMWEGRLLRRFISKRLTRPPYLPRLGRVPILQEGAACLRTQLGLKGPGDAGTTVSVIIIIFNNYATEKRMARPERAPEGFLARRTPHDPDRPRGCDGLARGRPRGLRPAATRRRGRSARARGEGLPRPRLPGDGPTTARIIWEERR